MNKYIDAELLREKIAEQMESLPREVGRGAGTITSKGYGMMQAFQIMRSIIDSLQQERPSLPSNLDEAAREYADESCFDDPEFTATMLAFKAGAELVISELFEKLKITPLKVIGKDEYGYPVYDFEIGHYYRTFTLFGQKYKCDQTDSGEAGEQMMAGQGYTTETKVDRTPLNGPAGICLNLHEYDGFKLGDRVIVQIRKKN